MGFSLTGTLIAVSVLLPNFLICFMPPQNVPKLHKPHIAVSIAENIGRIAILVILILSKDSINAVRPNLLFWLMCICTAVYYLLWIRYVVKDCAYAMLFKPLGPLPIPMAVFPILSFAFAAIWINSVLLFACVFVFAVGHIIHSLDTSLQIRTAKTANGLQSEKNKQKAKAKEALKSTAAFKPLEHKTENRNLDYTEDTVDDCIENANNTTAEDVEELLKDIEE